MQRTEVTLQIRWTDGFLFLDLDSGHYVCEILSHTPEHVTLQMTSPVCREISVQIVRTIDVLQIVQLQAARSATGGPIAQPTLSVDH